jgi:ubiquinone/menaquinone biosynthesis C-methylase UbiE
MDGGNRRASVAAPSSLPSVRNDDHLRSRAQDAGVGPARYELLKLRYRDRAVAARYDRERFVVGGRRRQNERELSAVERAIARTDTLGAPICDVLDLPCGTGRLFPLLGRNRYCFVGADVSLPMMEQARAKIALDGQPEGFIGLIQCEAERLPFKDRSFDCVVSLRFMLHLDQAARQQVLGEMARVTRRWLIVDFRHKYTTRHLTRLLRRKLAILSTVGHRFSRPALERELRHAGARLVEVFPSRRILRWFSEKWFVLAEVGSREPQSAFTVTVCVKPLVTEGRRGDRT